MDDLFTFRFFLTVIIIAVLNLMPLRWSRWFAGLVCAGVFVYYGEVAGLTCGLAIGLWAALLERRVA